MQVGESSHVMDLLLDASCATTSWLQPIVTASAALHTVPEAQAQASVRRAQSIDVLLLPIYIYSLLHTQKNRII